MPNALSEQTIAIVKQSAPALAACASQITSKMYELLFLDDHIKSLFNQANQGESGTQVHALAAAIVAYAQNIDNLSAISPVVERVAHKHIGYHILPEHYPFVARALLTAIEDVLGDAATAELVEAWEEAYWFLADTLKERETEIRTDIGARTGGWNGWRKFVVSERIKESDVVTSFILRPCNGGAIVRHRAGQYLTLRLALPEGTQIKRNYSISCGPNENAYRISVKREADGQGGSKYLHDHATVGTVLEATPPAGDFHLQEESSRPVVLLSGGVGLTPMVSMLEAIVNEHPGIEAYFLHGALNSSTHAMDRHVRALAKHHGRISINTFYSSPGPKDAVGLSHDHDGFITSERLLDLVPVSSADFYLCGPKPFLRSILGGLSSLGVSTDRIHYEIFGPTDELIAA